MEHEKVKYLTALCNARTTEQPELYESDSVFEDSRNNGRFTTQKLNRFQLTL